VWDRVGEVREIVYKTIADMSPPDWSFVFTNVLVADDPGDREVVERLSKLAQETARQYLPVRLTCEIGAQLERVVAPERGPRHKWTDATAVDRFVRAHDLVDVDGLDIDTTHQPPERSAVQILERLEQRGDELTP
jgi:hypothetical protein